MEDRCVMCGEVIPEGRMVCPSCEKNILKQELDAAIVATNATTSICKKLFRNIQP